MIVRRGGVQIEPPPLAEQLDRQGVEGLGDGPDAKQRIGGDGASTVAVGHAAGADTQAVST